MYFCGKDGDSGWLVAGTLNPCAFNTAAAVALAGATAATVLRRAAPPPTEGSSPWEFPGMRVPLAAQAIAAAALAALHSLAFVYFLDALHPTPYLLLSEALLALSWAAVVAVVGAARRQHAPLQLTALAWAAAAAYALGVYSELQFYFHGLGISPLQRQVRLVAGLVSGALALAFFVAELRKPGASPPSLSALHQPLLSPSADGSATPDLEAGAATARRVRKRSWVSLVGIAAKYIWPNELWLQLRACFCIALIVALRLLNLAVPIAYKTVVDTFSTMTAATHPSGDHKPAHFDFMAAFYPAVALYLGLWFLQGGSGGGGLLSNLRSYLWIPISQHSYRRACLDIFTHVLDMDHSFHLHRRTGELLRIMDRGTASMQTLLSTVAFQIGPAIFDILAAAVFMAVQLQPWIAIIVFVTLGAYIPMTVAVTEWRGKFRRDLNAKDNARGARATDALLNYETVKIFGNEGLEARLYADAIDAYQVIDFKLTATMNLLNVAQSMVIFVGVAAGLLVCTQGVANGSLTVGDAVLFVTLMQQLYTPLNYFGTFYRMLQNSMLDMEGIFDLLATQPGVQDALEAVPLQGSKYEITFDNVTFQYQDGDPVLNDVNFTAPGGATTALVGATGSGKSSLLRLLLRFYDPTAGRVCIDGQSLAGVTQASLRAVVGVVPQDTVLFNDTIRYNIRYGRPSASDAEVEAAAEAACIGETIRTRFPLGYDTLVGERGLRLSGGEKQRVAFARAILKDPPVLVLDEATSALDSLTERRIQSMLEAKRRGRTVVVVAHRLSTVMDADRIVVMEGGAVTEMGTHEELLQLGGKYAAMWTRQLEGGGEGASKAASRVASSVALIAGGEEIAEPLKPLPDS